MSGSLPFFSIIIPTHNRPQELGRCLAALARLDFPHDDFEVMIVDDGGQSSLEETLTPFQREMNLVLATQSRAGPAAARNAGARRAKGTFLAFTDDDCTPSAQWLSALAARLTGPPKCAVGGQTLNALPENIFSTASQSLIHYVYTYYNREPNHARFFASNNLAVPRELFHALAGFDASFPLAAAEDRDFCDRWLAQGNSLVYAPEAVVQHAHRLTLRSFLHQHWEYGRGAVYFHRARAARGQGRVQFEPPGFYWDLITTPFAERSPSALALCALLMLTQIATVFGFASETVSRSRRR